MKNSSDSLLFIVLMIFFFIDIICAIIFFVLYKKQRRECHEETFAIIVNRSLSRNKNYIYTVNGIEYKYPLSVYSSIPIRNFTSGEIVICYDINNPKNAYVKNNRFLSIFWILFFACSISSIMILLANIILYLFT